MSLFPLARFDRIDNAVADARLVEWGHWLEGCHRPFGRQSFMGSGTVGRVALSLGRRAIGCDLNPAYLALADERLTVTRGLPLEVGA